MFHSHRALIDAWPEGILVFLVALLEFQALALHDFFRSRSGNHKEKSDQSYHYGISGSVQLSNPYCHVL